MSLFRSLDEHLLYPDTSLSIPPRLAAAGVSEAQLVPAARPLDGLARSFPIERNTTQTPMTVGSPNTFHPASAIRLVDPSLLCLSTGSLPRGKDQSSSKHTLSHRSRFTEYVSYPRMLQQNSKLRTHPASEKLILSLPNSLNHQTEALKESRSLGGKLISRAPDRLANKQTGLDGNRRRNPSNSPALKNIGRP